MSAGVTFDFSGRRVLVTGGSSGIGLGIARAFLERGDRVVLHGRDPEKLAAAAASLEASDNVAYVAGDFGTAATGEALVRTAVERFGGVDVLVNNAGTFGATPFLEVSEEELDGYLQGNLKGTYLTTQARHSSWSQARATLLFEVWIPGLPLLSSQNSSVA